ncbi:MAG: enoyl-CoA hydratase/isomerase family protein [Chloroflexi bacterium]|nr:enoyl-CoA hydratase/isomerase family protein [Chloroflexota bacterium]
MSNGTAIHCRHEGGAAWLTLSRPQRCNRLDPAMAAELRAACAQTAQDSTVRVAVLRAEGDNFCTGTEDAPLGEDRELYFTQTAAACALAALPVPVIAAIQGDCLDQGLELALACDLRLADSSARFGLTHALRSTLPWDGGSQRLPRLVGRSRALEMLLTGRIVDAEEAARIGLVHQVVPSGALSEMAIAWANSLAEKAPIALRYVKEAALKGLDHTLEQGLRLEADLYFLLFSTDDREEGLRSWREKRPPHFSGE